MRNIPNAPRSLVDATGNLQPYGGYRGLIDDVGTARWDRGVAWPRRLQRKSWVFVGVYHDDFALGYAVADAGYLATAFLYVLDRVGRTTVEEVVEMPFGFGEGFAPSLRTRWAFGRGGRQWRVDPDGEGLRLRYDGKRLACDLRIDSLDGGMTTLAPSLHRPFNHTFKRLCLPVRASVRIDDKRFEQTLPHGAALDFTLGYPPRDTRWNWACLQGHTEDGRSFGLNLVAHFNDEIENAMWLDDELIPLGRASFTVGRPADQGAWSVRVDEIGLSITFTPEGARKDRKNLGLLSHDFVQPCGRFEGTLRRNDITVPISGFGVVEDHTSRW